MPLAIGFLLLIVVALVTAWFSVERGLANQAVQRTLEIELRLSKVLSLMQDAETGQRGYLLSGDEGYLLPYETAVRTIAAEVNELRKLMSGSSQQNAHIAALQAVIDDKLRELAATIERWRSGATGEALAMVKAGAGKMLMDRVRAILGEMRAVQGGLLLGQQARVEAANARMQSGTVAAFLLLLGVAGFALFKVQQQALGLVAVNTDLRSAHTKLLEAPLHRQHAEGQMRQVQKMDAIGQLTGGLAHDFNNMLAVIFSALNLLKRRMERGQTNVGELVDAAIDGAQRAATLTQRLLAFARKQPLSPEAIDPNKFVAGISDLLRRTLGETIKLETVLAGGLWRVHADAAQLETAILNLAVNARDAMGEGGGRLTIETANAHLDDAYAAQHISVPAGQYVLIAVTDTGRGMTAKTIEQAFDPFFTTKAVGRGTGLGLSQVHGFVKQSLGHVKIYSEIGSGTTVKLYLPRFRGAEEPVAQAKHEKPLQAGRLDEVVLVVEDEEQVRHLSVEALRELGYTVVESHNAVQALEILDQRSDVTLLFTDIVMPDIDGRKLADEAVRRKPGLKVLYTTGYTNNAIIHNGVLDAGVHLITKPFTLEQLGSKVREALAAPELVK